MEKILNVLKEKQGQYVSGENLAKLSGLTRAGIWKQINHLREIGYIITSSPRKGYKLEYITNALHPFEIKDNLDTLKFGKTIYFKEEVGSTNNWAKQLAAQGAAEGTVAITERQTEGRGRLGRTWASAEGKGLWFSLVLRPQVSAAALAGITIMTAVSMSKAIYQTTGIQVDVKWPNDLLFQGKKLTGILAEMNGEMDRVNYLIIGIGLNVNHLISDFPEELQERATSLRIIGNREFDRKLILKEFLAIFESDYHRLTVGESQEIIHYARKHSATLGRQVTVSQGFGQTVSGKAVELDLDGSLWLEREDGKREKIYSGEVI